jgi:hypothetical protein
MEENKDMQCGTLDAFKGQPLALQFTSGYADASNGVRVFTCEGAL